MVRTPKEIFEMATDVAGDMCPYDGHYDLERGEHRAYFEAIEMVEKLYKEYTEIYSNLDDEDDEVE